MGILALDLGTKTGFAIERNGVVVSGTQDFQPKRFESSAMRFIRFVEFLDTTRNASDVVHVVYEEVRRHMGVDAAHAYGGFMSHLLAWCEVHKLPCEAYPVGSIKKAWTGKGNASKEAMIAEAKRRGFDVGDDNEADALAMLDMAMGGLPSPVGSVL